MRPIALVIYELRKLPDFKYLPFSFLLFYASVQKSIKMESSFLFLNQEHEERVQVVEGTHNDWICLRAFPVVQWLGLRASAARFHC